MVNRETLKNWVVEALTNLNGSGHLVDVFKQVWKFHRAEIEGAGDLFYTWQYDIRWAATALRHEGRLRSAEETMRGTWELVPKSDESEA